MNLISQQLNTIIHWHSVTRGFMFSKQHWPHKQPLDKDFQLSSFDYTNEYNIWLIYKLFVGHQSQWTNR
jgi:hypothetical protein